MTAREWLAKRAELEEAAPPAPWHYREGANGDPANGPDYTALTATGAGGGEVTLAEGGYDSWSGYALIFAADARTTAPAMRKALEAVLEQEGPRGHGDYSDWSDGYHAALEAILEVITTALEPTP